MNKNRYRSIVGSPRFACLSVLLIGTFLLMWAMLRTHGAEVQSISRPLSPQDVVRTFCKLDADGSRLSSGARRNIDPLLDWGEEGGYDEFIVIRDFKVNKAIIHNSTATVTVEYHVLGSTDSFQFSKASDHRSLINFSLLKQNSSWKIRQPLIAPHVYWNQAITHLESLQEDEPVRRKQLEIIIEMIKDELKNDK